MCAQGRCATRLRYAPTVSIIAIFAASGSASTAPRSDGLHSCQYNEFFMMGLMYAAVTYVRSPAGIFVEELRRELHPAHTHADAHITILPPRQLQGTEEQAIQQLRDICRSSSPFEVTMGDVETFIPSTPTVFIRVAHGAYRIRELHEHLNRGALRCKEPWPYMPHLTIVKMDTVEEARKVVALARPRWDNCEDSRKVPIASVTFVKGTGERWIDLANIPLGYVPTS